MCDREQALYDADTLLYHQEPVMYAVELTGCHVNRYGCWGYAI